MTRIKLCGLRRPEDAMIVNRYLPEYVGFILAPPFWRYIAPEKVARLKMLLDPRIQRVGVFVDQEPEHIASLLNSGLIDVAQLHGYEDNAYIRQLRQLTDRPIYQAIKVASKEDVARAHSSLADKILLDGGTGTGQTFDWRLLEQVDREFFLAGGLNPDNIEEALRRVHPFGVDVSSGVETDKRKDEEKVRRFVETVRMVSSG